MRLKQLDTGGEGSLFVFHSRSGIVLLRAFAALAMVFIVIAAVTRNVEWLILAGVWGGAALLSWPIVRWMGWRDITVSLTSSMIRILKDPDSPEALRTVEIEPGQPVEARLGRVAVDRQGKKTKYYDVIQGGNVVLIGLSSRYEAKQIAEELSAAISS